MKQRDGLILNTATDKDHQVEPVRSWPEEDITPLYGRSLETAFDAVVEALDTLDLTPNGLGTSRYWVHAIDPDLLDRLKRVAINQELLPVSESLFGVNMIERGSMIWERLLLHTFKGSRLWAEIIEPHFNHVFLGAVLNDRIYRDIFVYDLEVPRRWELDYETPNAVAARRIGSLMSRCGLDAGPPVHWYLRMNIIDQLEAEGIERGSQEWRDRRLFYWKINDHQLITAAMKEFMQGRELLTIEVNLPTAYSKDSLRKVLNHPDVIEYIGKALSHESGEVESKPELLSDLLLDLYAGEVIAYIRQMLFVGGRFITKQDIPEYIETVLSRKSGKYTFYSAVRKEYLAAANTDT